MKYLLQALALLTVAATAAAQVPDASTVKDSVDALSIAGPWLGMLLIAAGYFDLRKRESECTKAAREAEAKHAASIAAHKAEADAKIETLTKRVEELHSSMFNASEHDASVLLAHAKEVAAIVENVGRTLGENTVELKRNTSVLERVAERIK